MLHPMSSPPPSADGPLRPALKHHLSSSSDLQLTPFPSMGDKQPLPTTAEQSTSLADSPPDSLRFPRARTMTHRSDSMPPCEHRVSFDTFEAADGGALGGGIGVCILAIFMNLCGILQKCLYCCPSQINRSSTQSHCV